MTNKILLVDDEKDIVGLVEEVLQREGFQSIQKAFTGKEAVNLCQQFQPDVVVLDIMLPDMDGLEVCRKIREFSYCSILFLSSRSDDVDKILGLSCGGDDYITKPFSPREVVFRIKAQLRRQQYQAVQPVNEQSCLAAGPLTLDKESCRLYKDGKEIGLTGPISWKTQIRSSVKSAFMSRYGANIAAFVTIRSWCISDTCGRKLKILRLTRSSLSQ